MALIVHNRPLPSAPDPQRGSSSGRASRTPGALRNGLNIRSSVRCARCARRVSFTHAHPDFPTGMICGRCCSMLDHIRTDPAPQKPQRRFTTPTEASENERLRGAVARLRDALESMLDGKPGAYAAAAKLLNRRTNHGANNGAH